MLVSRPRNSIFTSKESKELYLFTSNKVTLLMAPIRISTISSKGQTTVPVAIRRTLDLHPGDAIAYEVEGDKVSIHKAAKTNLEWAKALEQTLAEWQDEEDDDL